MGVCMCVCLCVCVCVCVWAHWHGRVSYTQCVAAGAARAIEKERESANA